MIVVGLLWSGCRYAGNKVFAPGKAEGAGLHIDFKSTIIDLVISIERSSFIGGRAWAVDSKGGGACIVSSSSGDVLVMNTTFDSNYVWGGSRAEGGGAYISNNFQGSTTKLSHATFSTNHINTSAVGSAQGGGLVLCICHGVVKNSMFVDNQASGSAADGGGMSLRCSSFRAPDSDCRAIINSGYFHNNSAGGSGGGVYFGTAGGLALDVNGTIRFIGNKATNGGGAAIAQTARNIPSNLAMVYLPPYTDENDNPIPALCYDTSNSSSNNSTFHQYSYASPRSLFDSAVFDSNRAVGTGGSGGALYVLDMIQAHLGYKIGLNLVS